MLQDNYSAYLKTRYFGSLDGLRAIAILAVFWHHFATVIPGLYISGRGFLGVDLFFVISGFLIVTLLLRERRRTGSVSVRDFYIRRFLRIFPPYYLMLLVVALSAFLMPGSTSAAIKRDLPFAAFYLSNLVPMSSVLSITWSLSAEEQFYLVVPALEKHAQGIMTFLLPAAYVMAALPPFGFFPELELPRFFRETTFGPILLGAMLAHVLDNSKGFGLASSFFARRFSPLLFLVILGFVASYPGEDISGWQRLLTHWAMLGLVASCVINEKNMLLPILSFEPIRRVGVVSYGMYLYQYIVGHFVGKGLAIAGVSWYLTNFICVALVTWAVSECSYRYFETRFLAMKVRFSCRADVNRET